MPTPSRLNIVGFGVLFVASAGLSIYALLRTRDGAARSASPAPAVVRVEVERDTEPAKPLPASPPIVAQQPTAPDPVRSVSAPVRSAPDPVRSASPPVSASLPAAITIPFQPDPATAAVVAALDGLGAWAAHGFGNADPRFAAAADVVRGHLPVAVAHWQGSRRDDYTDEAMTRAILLAIQDADREAVLASLNSAPWLVEALVPHGWVVAAHDVLRQRMADEDRRLPDPPLAWAMALAAAATPDDYPLLARVLMRLPVDSYQMQMIERMRAMPGCDWQAAVLLAWEGRSSDRQPDAHQGLAVLAAQAGSRDALVAVGAMTMSDRQLRERAQAWLAAQPATGGVPRPAEWFATVRDRLDFHDGSWRLGNARAVAASTMQRPQPRLPAAQPDPPSMPLPAGLADGADAAAVRAWIDSKAPAMAGRKSMHRDDPVTRELAAVPPEHLRELLLAEERHKANFGMGVALQEAIIRSVRQQHRDLVLDRLAQQVFLVEVLVARGWVADAAPTLRRLLAAGSTNDLEASTRMVEDLALLGDPADHAVLRETLVRMHYGYWQARMAVALEAMPGFDADAAVRAAWGKFARSDYGDGQDSFAVVAARHGVVAALPIVVAHATGGEVKHTSDTLAKEARAFLVQSFAIGPEPEAIAAWWATARPSVRWDEPTRRWIGPSAAPPTAPSGGNF